MCRRMIQEQMYQSMLQVIRFSSSFFFFISALVHCILAANYKLQLWKTNHHFDSFYDFTKVMSITSSTKAVICERSFCFSYRSSVLF